MIDPIECSNCKGKGYVYDPAVIISDTKSDIVEVSAILCPTCMGSKLMKPIVDFSYLLFPDKHGDMLSDAAVEDLKKQWAERYKGLKNADVVKVVGGEDGR